ncbi:MAG TPA: FG-GAP-like repeat-containing protein [Herpetosiphonaceae bacterium]
MPFISHHRTARRVALTFLVVFAMSLFVEGVFAQSATFARTDYPLLGNTHIVGDFNGDGNLDLAGSGAQSAAVMLGNGDGTLRARADYPVAAQAQDLATGDFNGDGKLDLVVTINDPRISLSLLTGNGDGTFNPPVNLPNTSGFDSPVVVATDLDNDGRLDVVIAHQIACFTAPCVVSRTISVLLGLGDGTFRPAREIDVGTGMAEIVVGDFNRDGRKDLGIAGDRSQVYILLGVGDGTFIRQPTITPIPENNIGVDGTDIDTADFNGDGLQDLAVAFALNGSRTVILMGNGDGTFRQPMIITEPGTRIPHYQAVADYNGDGFQDLALSLGWGLQGWMEILDGNGDGTFKPPVLYLVPDPNSSTSGGVLASADFNRDGKPDIALQFVGASSGLVMLRNTTGTVPPPTPQAPTLLSPPHDATVAQPVTFDWSDVTGAASYTIQIDDSSTFTAPQIVSQSVTASTFTASSLPATRLWWRVRGVNSAGVAGPWSVTRRFTAQEPPPPPGAAALSTLTLSPTSVVGGAAAQGTVTLTSAAPSGGASVALAMSNTVVATVPASVTVAAGTTSVTFALTTKTVTASTSVAISAAYGGVSKAATLTVQPPPPAADTVAIQIAEYASGNRQLRVEATSSHASAALNVYITSTNTLIGALRHEGDGRYRGDFSLASNPQNITVRSSLGGEATRAVTLK